MNPIPAEINVRNQQSRNTEWHVKQHYPRVFGVAEQHKQDKENHQQAHRHNLPQPLGGALLILKIATASSTMMLKSMTPIGKLADMPFSRGQILNASIPANY